MSSSLLDNSREGRHVTHLIHPGLDLTGDQTLELDARLGQPLSVTVPNTAAAQLNAQLTYSVSVPGTTTSRGLISDRFENMATAQLGPDRTYDGVTTKVGGLWAQTDADGGTDNSPRTYNLAWFHDGGMVTGFRREVAGRDLAAISTDYAAHLTGVQGRASSGAIPPDKQMRIYLAETRFATPSIRTEYVNTDGGARWLRAFREYGPDGEATWFESPFTSYVPGRTYRESWNRGVFSPTLPPAGTDSRGLTRTGDTILANVPLHGDGAGRYGWAATSRARTALYRDGTLLAEQPTIGGEFTVPAGQANYRLVMESERAAPATLSTRTSTAWTFRSGHVEGDQELPLPASVIRFSPELDPHNTAPAGRPYGVPITVQSQAGTAKSRTLTVDVSYDDGTTWSRAKTVGSTALLLHPSTAGFVSLRAKSTDTAGNTVEQTIIRAYRIAPRG